MKTSIALCAALGTAAMAMGQEAAEPFQGKTLTEDHLHPVTVAPRSAMDEGPHRFEMPPVEWGRLAELPERDRHHSGSNPPGFLNQGISLDAESGLESRWTLGESSFMQRVWTLGQELANQDDERNYQGPSWTKDLTEVLSESFPWSTQCRLLYDDPDNGNTHMASATIIDARYVITAGHTVSKGSGKGWYTNFRVLPAWDGDDDAFGSSGWSSVATFTDWHVNGNFDGDMGFIRLNRPVGFLTGWLGYGYDNDDSFYTGELFNMAGYPSAGCYDGVPDQLYYGWGVYDSAAQYRLTADAYWSCASSGMNGAASYWIDSGNRFVLACHSTRCYSCDPDEIGHTRMSQGKYDYFHDTFMPDGYSNTDPDYVPLDVNIAGTSFTAGEQLPSLDYLVGNMSLYNPFGTQQYTVNVYLSTNDNISVADTLIQTHTFDWNFGARTSVRVDVNNPPSIPADTPTGNYWIGVIIDFADDDPNNNDTDGWDAVAVSVTGCSVQMNQFGVGLAGSGGFVPEIFGTGDACQGSGHSITIIDTLGGTFGFLWAGVAQTDVFPFFGGHFYVDLGQAWVKIPISANGPIGVPGAGWLTLPGTDKAGLQGLSIYLQGTLSDPGAINNVSLTNGLEMVIQE